MPDNLVWFLHVALPITLGTVAFLLCLAVVLVMIGVVPLHLLPDRLRMSILDGYTDVAQLKARLAETSRSLSYEINRTAVSEYMKSKIIGQDHIVDDVVNEIHSQYLREKRRGAVAVFMIAGPTRTAKSLFGLSLGQALFGEHGFVEFDMSTANDTANANAVFGSPMGHVGSERSAASMKHLIDNPRTVVVVDEFEKASEAVRNRFLSAWRDGKLLNVATGKWINTRDMIFVVTTNAAHEQMTVLGQQLFNSLLEMSRQGKKILGEEFKPELLSRVDRVYAFKPLEEFGTAELIGLNLIEYVQSFGIEISTIDLEFLLAYFHQIGGHSINPAELYGRIRDDWREPLVAFKLKNVRRVRFAEKKGKLSLEAAGPA